MIKEEEYQLAHMSESFGSHGDFGIKIFIATGRKLTEEDGNKVRRIADTIEETRCIYLCTRRIICTYCYAYDQICTDPKRRTA